MAEGDYMAALRGSKSEQWQTSTFSETGKGRFSPGNAGFSFNHGAAMGGNLRQGGCYNCGKEGHWSQDCPMPTAGSQIAAKIDKPEKPCPCGAGLCSVLTSNTPKNPGRQFFRCPRKPNEGQCNFFEWCDAAASMGQSPSKVPTNQQTSEPEIKCASCGQACVVLTAKTEKNIGRRFYKCPSESCNFFKWCDELNSTPAYVSPGISKAPGGHGSLANNAPGAAVFRESVRGYSSQDCQNVSHPKNYTGGNVSGGFGRGSINTGAETGGLGFGGQSSCYMCGQEGHWSRDCPNKSGGNRGAMPMPKTTGNCYKCGGAGHWASNCHVGM